MILVPLSKVRLPIETFAIFCLGVSHETQAEFCNVYISYNALKLYGNILIDYITA